MMTEIMPIIIVVETDGVAPCPPADYDDAACDGWFIYLSLRTLGRTGERWMRMFPHTSGPRVVTTKDDSDVRYTYYSKEGLTETIKM